MRPAHNASRANLRSCAYLLREYSTFCGPELSSLKPLEEQLPEGLCNIPGRRDGEPLLAQLCDADVQEVPGKPKHGVVRVRGVVAIVFLVARGKTTLEQRLTAFRDVLLEE